MTKNYVVLYDPKEHAKKIHKCDLPDLTTHRRPEDKIWWQTIIECEECARKWVAMCYTDAAYNNKWVPLKWHHFKWRRNLKR